MQTVVGLTKRLKTFEQQFRAQQDRGHCAMYGKNTMGYINLGVWFVTSVTSLVMSVGIALGDRVWYVFTATKWATRRPTIRYRHEEGSSTVSSQSEDYWRQWGTSGGSRGEGTSISVTNWGYWSSISWHHMYVLYSLPSCAYYYFYLWLYDCVCGVMFGLYKFAPRNHNFPMMV